MEINDKDEREEKKKRKRCKKRAVYRKDKWESVEVETGGKAREIKASGFEKGAGKKKRPASAAVSWKVF